jgi:hypothetical protein
MSADAGTNKHDVVFDLCATRVRAESLEQELSECVGLLYSFLVLLLSVGGHKVEKLVRSTLSTKILQLPQGSSLGRRLIALDRQYAGLLDEMGIPLERWVYEPRGRGNGTS